MLFHAIYIEKDAVTTPLAQQICRRYPQLPHITCEHYGEIFNRKKQNFRIQKATPALILANKQNNYVHPTPPGYGIGGVHNYYFSHMMNCIYDCRYCFLQGMYSSSHYVLFTNRENFYQEIESKCQAHPGRDVYFFSGYDCDSLALEPITGFAESSLDFFQKTPQAYLELRTKSTQIGFLLRKPPMHNVIIAFTLSPERVCREVEHRTPPLHRRLEAMKRLADAGWQLGLRFDPLMYSDNFESEYEEFFAQVFSTLPASSIHSITLGSMRFPKHIHKRMQKLYPEESLFYRYLTPKDHQSIGYHQELDKRLTNFALENICTYAPSEKIFVMSEQEPAYA